MNPLFNSAAYQSCFEGTLIFELKLAFKYMAQSGTVWFLTHLFLIIVPSMPKAALKNFPGTQFFILFDLLNFNKTALDL